MKHCQIPYCTIILSLATLAYSLFVAFDVNGSFFGKVRIVDLEAYGGVTFNHVNNFELWRLFASQMIHVKQLHMLYNVLSLIVLGSFIERYAHFSKFFMLWFVSGAIGTLVSTLFVEPPWNLGTGASQAILGVAAFGVVLVFKKIDVSTGLKIAIGFAVLPALALDLIYSGYPKPGHISGFLVGLAISLIYLKQYRAPAASNAGM